MKVDERRDFVRGRFQGGKEKKETEGGERELSELGIKKVGLAQNCILCRVLRSIHSIHSIILFLNCPSSRK